MRGIAKRKGYLLNQNGLFASGKLLKVKSEKEIFDFLKIGYVKPEFR
jgi:DNA polymerase/3'-5' exonuclease PolX